MKKNYLLVNTSFFPSAGGVETTLRGMTEGLVDDGQNVVIVASNRANISAEGLKSYEKLFGAEVFRYAALPFFLYYLTCTFLLLKLKRKYKFDLVISRSYTTTLCLWLAGYKNIKYVAPATYSKQNHPQYTSGNSAKRYISYFINSNLERLALKAVPSVYVFSSEMRNQINEISKRKPVIQVFPGIDRKRFKPVSQMARDRLREKYSIPTSKKVLLFIGRVEKVKNSLDCIRVLKNLPSNYITVFVGEGSQRQEAINYAISESLDDRVFFYDFTKSPEEFFQLSDAFLMTSVYEPFGQVILEALACGVKVFGYQSSNNIKTATSEIFKRLNISTERYLSESNSIKLASLIEKDLSIDSQFEASVLSWADFVYGLERMT